MKKILRFITQRVVITALLIVLQALLLFGFIWKLDNYFVYFYAGSVLLSLLITLGIINSKSNPAYKIAWLIPILLFPVFGGLVYLLFGSDRTGRYLRKKLQGIGTEMDNVIGEAHRRSARSSCRRTRPTSPATFPTAPTARPIRTPPPSIFRWARSSLSGWWRN